MPDLTFHPYSDSISLPANRICGIDEAGRGPWAGPVTAAAVIWPDHLSIPEQLNDSKKLTAAKRDVLFDYIRDNVPHGIASASVEEIDARNILAATKLAMQRAYEELQASLTAQGLKPPRLALIDGNQPPTLACERVDSVIKGDGKIIAIAAASILAKVSRDREMQQLAAIHPHYGWESNAGYGTKAHQEGIAHHGITPHHRRSFAPIKKALAATQEPASISA